MATIEALDVVDVRFPTSTDLDGSDAMNPDPDYSAAYATLRVDDGLDAATGSCSPSGAATTSSPTPSPRSRPYVVGRDADELTGDLGLLSRTLIGDSQLRWLGPEKGVMHMAIGAVVNAVWDLAARRAGQPLWRFLGDLSPEQLVSLVDFRYLTDALTPGEALELLHASARASGRAPNSCSPRATRPTPRRPAGSATATTSSPASPRRRWPPATPRSSSRWDCR